MIIVSIHKISSNIVWIQKKTSLRGGSNKQGSEINLPLLCSGVKETICSQRYRLTFRLKRPSCLEGGWVNTKQVSKKNKMCIMLWFLMKFLTQGIIHDKCQLMIKVNRIRYLCGGWQYIHFKEVQGISFSVHEPQLWAASALWKVPSCFLQPVVAPA